MNPCISVAFFYISLNFFRACDKYKHYDFFTYHAIEKWSKLGHLLQDYLFPVQTLMIKLGHSISLLRPNPQSMGKCFKSI